MFYTKAYLSRRTVAVTVLRINTLSTSANTMRSAQVNILHVVSFSGYITDHLRVLKEGIQGVCVLCFPVLPFHVSDVVNTSKSLGDFASTLCF